MTFNGTWRQYLTANDVPEPFLKQTQRMSRQAAFNATLTAVNKALRDHGDPEISADTLLDTDIHADWSVHSQSLGEHLADLGETIANAAAQVGINAALAPLYPFKASMAHALDRKGIAHTSKLENIARAFYGMRFGSYAHLEHVEPISITLIVSAILKLFKDLKAKKDAGKSMSTEDRSLLDDVSGVIDTIGAALGEGGGDEGQAAVHDVANNGPPLSAPPVPRTGKSNAQKAGIVVAFFALIAILAR